MHIWPNGFYAYLVCLFEFFLAISSLYLVISAFEHDLMCVRVNLKIAAWTRLS